MEFETHLNPFVFLPHYKFMKAPNILFTALSSGPRSMRGA